jgi:hypothetical protein
MIQAKAYLITRDMQASGVNVGDAVGAVATPNPNLITTIIAIITSLLGAFGSCGQTPAAIQRAMVNPGPLHRRAFKRTVRQHEHNPALWDPMMQSSLNVASTFSVADVEAMCKEVPPA